ncbi:hypothetical protein B7767_34035 [Streptomyces sp. 13-12-16]|uniref:hypothetical protein n=2 Tax=unclassified Streptomyces TaxID=2593676 RepID=UPI000A1DA46B|nr:hypothetical protein [Streptomyces sp. 13-12-16]OSP39009.1 hypothetical protein B7767_34035 [Streptomyces sp. 13-12-16]
MRRTARALSLAAATGAALAALAPAASAGTVPDDGTSWGTTSPSPCPQPEGHEWEPDAALAPAGPEAVVPKSTALDDLESDLESELDAGPDAEPDAGLDADADAEPGADAGPGFGAEIPAPQESDLADPEAADPYPADPEAAEPEALRSGSTTSRAPASRTPGPKPEPTGSKGTPCPTAPAHQGVHAGAGGAFTDSVPALAAGGLLIAGAFGAAAHRVYRDRTTRADG